MKRRVVVAVVFAVLLAASAHAQTTDFFVLVQTGTPQSVQDAITKGANIKAQDGMGRTPFMVAAIHNQNPEVISTLLKAGADINARDSLDATCLIYAAGSNRPEVITTLLKAGANLNVADSNGATTLMSAAANNHNPDVITTLIKAGADINAQDTTGEWGIHFAPPVLASSQALALRSVFPVVAWACGNPQKMCTFRIC